MDGEGNENRPGSRLIAGRYATLGELGRGGMGVVWRAEDRVIGRQVALKELPLPHGVGSGERAVYLERVLREARTAGRLNHPAVVTVYDVLSEHGSIYIVMELVEGSTLADVIAREGPLPSERVAALGMSVLGALETAHAAEIVHRDVKPSNIMVLPDDRVKLADFGIAQALDDQTLTATGGIMGSPGYVAPELFAGSAPSPASDLWALGVTLFHVVEGQAPFHRDTTAATMYAVMHDEPAFQRCQGPLASVIAGLLARSTDARLTGPQARELLSSVAGRASRPDQPGEPVTLPAFGDATTRFVDTPSGALGPPAPRGDADLAGHGGYPSAVGPVQRSTLPQPWQDPYNADTVGVAEPIRAPTAVPWHAADWTPQRGPARRKVVLVVGGVAVVVVLGLVAALLIRPGAQRGLAAAAPSAGTSSSVAATSASATLTTTPSGSAVSTTSASMSSSSAGQRSSAGANAAKATLTQGPGSPPIPSLNNPGQPATTTTSPKPARTLLVLRRYNHSPDPYHFTGTDNVSPPPGFNLESTVVLGSLVASAEPGAQKLYACQSGQDLFSSLLANCEGQQVNGVLGYIFSTPPGDVATAPLYRCLFFQTHFDSRLPSCEGQPPELTLGYVVSTPG